MARPPGPRLAVLALLLGACAREAPTRSEFGVPSQLKAGRPSRLNVTIENGGGAEATFTADMTHPGMTPVVVRASETAPGTYAADVNWTMAGDWVVIFEARWPDGRKYEAQAAVTVR